MNELAKCLMIWGQGLPTSIIKKTKESGEAWKLGFDLGYSFFLSFYFAGFGGEFTL